MIVRHATRADRPAIDDLRYTHFASYELAVQERSPDAVWWCAEHDERIVGCCCLEDVPTLRQRWLLDCYAVPAMTGKRALIAMYARIRTDATADGYTIVGFCQPNNIKQIAAYQRRGGHIVGVMLSLDPQVT